MSNSVNFSQPAVRQFQVLTNGGPVLVQFIGPGASSLANAVEAGLLNSEADLVMRLDTLPSVTAEQPYCT